MSITAKTLRTQLSLIKPLMDVCSLKTIRTAHYMTGELMKSLHGNQVIRMGQDFEKFDGAWIIPKDERREGAILYLHGGGYACGDLEYAMGFGSFLAAECGTRVFCIAYRLAPEHPFPAAIEDALEAYRYLLAQGYTHISLCGESAGGGLCYALGLKLRELDLPMPAGIIAISPWTDLTLSGESYSENKKNDPSMTEELLSFFADNYTKDKENPLASPLFANFTGFPPSLLFVGGDEIMLSDSKRLHERLLEAGCQSRLIIAKEKWHGYLLYGLKEDSKDLAAINLFLNQVMLKETKLRWLPLDNAAKIYPAARRRVWSNVFRLSATLNEPVDIHVMQDALDVTVRRFPSIAVKLRRGIFWYYLRQLSEVPMIREEYEYPLTRMSREETSKCAFRVIVYDKRVAVEIFHSLTDGTGALIFLKSLVAEYLQQKYSIVIPSTHGVLNRVEEPAAAELEDSYQKYAGNVPASRRENNAWHLEGTPEPDGFLHLTCFTMPVRPVLDLAHSYAITLTDFLCACMLMALQNMQEEHVPSIRRRKPLKILIPVNLRKLFPSQSLRNFALYTTPEIQPRLGRYSFDEICHAVHHHMGVENTPKQMSMKIATNVLSERIFAFKILPLFLKDILMKAVFDAVGEKKSCFTFSNLGAVKLPAEMEKYVDRIDFILGVQATAPHNCSVLSYKDTLYVNFIRNICESDLEYHFFRVLQRFGLDVTVQSNGR